MPQDIERKAAMKEITDQIEQGIQDLFNSENYKKYLNTMSKFHDYSPNNIIKKNSVLAQLAHNKDILMSVSKNQAEKGKKPELERSCK